MSKRKISTADRLADKKRIKNRWLLDKERFQFRDPEQQPVENTTIKLIFELDEETGSFELLSDYVLCDHHSYAGFYSDEAQIF